LSFQAQLLMSCGSFEPPPVKIVALRAPSFAQETAVELVVPCETPQRAAASVAESPSLSIAAW
jgi:hypothetical protein